MITNADKELLDETYRTAGLSVASIYSVLGRITDEDLALDLNRQAGKYQAIQDRAEDALLDEGQCPDTYGMEKWKKMAVLYGKTIRNTSAEHIANLMIKDSTKAIARTNKALSDNTQAGDRSCEMARELVDFTQKNIEQLKQYL